MKYSFEGLAAILLSFLVAAPGSPLSPPAEDSCAKQKGYSYGVEVELVTIFATVRDGTGKLVTNLDQEDFVVYEDGVPQQVSQFSRAYQPLSVLVLLDTSFSMSGRTIEYAKAGLSTFLDRLEPKDEVMLMTFGVKTVPVIPFTEDTVRVKGSLKRLACTGRTALYDSILAALDATEQARNRRRALLLISDGINTYGHAELSGTIERLKRTGVELFAIGLESNLPGDEYSETATESILDTLTGSAGGESFLLRKSRELESICGTISDRLHSQYTFGYYPARPAAGLWRSLRVETTVPGCRVVASKTGYYSESRTP